MSEPRRVGLMQLLMSSTGCQFVIPVYQRNYTWSAEREVKQYHECASLLFRVWVLLSLQGPFC